MPLFMGGKKCECYEKRNKERTKKFNYPTKEELENDKRWNSKNAN